MNIFKVFASAKNGMQEQFASVILAWLMNPKMEHGLGYAFLSEYLRECGDSLPNLSPLKDLATSLVTRLRNNCIGNAESKTYLEFCVDQAFIDLVIDIKVANNSWIIAIENKIFDLSATDPKQLVREYQGLKKQQEYVNCRIIIILLAPASQNKASPSLPNLPANGAKNIYFLRLIVDFMGFLGVEKAFVVTHNCCYVLTGFPECDKM